MFEILKKQGLVMSIAISEIFPNPFQPRRSFDEGELFALGESIRENGLIQPISVRKTKGGFELIAGERRLRACKIIGRQKIEAIVYDIGDEESATWALIENLQRSDLGPFEEAQALFKLVSLWNVPRDEAAKRLGIASSTLSNKLRILKLNEAARKIVIENNLTERHARELLRIEDEKKREEAAKFIAEKELNVPETVKFIDKLFETKKPERRKPRFFVKDLRLFINTFEHAVEVMNSAGMEAVSSVSENEENLIYTVLVPKAKAFRNAEGSAK